MFITRVFHTAATAAIIATVFVAGAQAQTAMKSRWEVTGLHNPESVVYHAPSNALLVSNVHGSSADKDGKGYISKVSLDGKILQQKWVGGMNAPKGMALHGNTLYVSDIDALVVIDIPSGKITRKHQAPNAKFLNDVAATPQGDVYVSDMLTNRIHRLRNGQFSVWLESPKLESPNGLFVDGDALILGAWGVMTDGFATATPGHLKRISLSDKSIVSYGGTPIGNLDGVERATSDSYYVTDWVAGKLFRINKKGEATLLLQLTQGMADLAVLPQHNLLLLPMMRDNKLLAYALP